MDGGNRPGNLFIKGANLRVWKRGRHSKNGTHRRPSEKSQILLRNDMEREGKQKARYKESCSLGSVEKIENEGGLLAMRRGDRLMKQFRRESELQKTGWEKLGRNPKRMERGENIQRCGGRGASVQNSVEGGEKGGGGRGVSRQNGKEIGNDNHSCLSLQNQARPLISR